MATSVLELIPKGGSAGWDQMGLGYNTTSPIYYSHLELTREIIFSFENAAVAGVIDKIVLWFVAAGHAIEVVSTNGRISIGGTKYSTTPQFTISGGTPTIYTATQTLNPKTGNAWTWPEIDAFQGGLILLGNWGSWANIYQFKLQVTYTPEVYVPPTLTKGSVACGCGSMMF